MIKLLKVEILTVTLQASLSFKLCNTHGMPTFHFKIEVLCIVSNVQLIERLLLQNEWQIQHYLALL